LHLRTTIGPTWLRGGQRIPGLPPVKEYSELRHYSPPKRCLQLRQPVLLVEGSCQYGIGVPFDDDLAAVFIEAALSEKTSD
jgi:hypothetical protein